MCFYCDFYHLILFSIEWRRSAIANSHCEALPGDSLCEQGLFQTGAKLQRDNASARGSLPSVPTPSFVSSHHTV